MSFQVGLSASEDDLEVQGEIDFDFFDGDGSNRDNKPTAISNEIVTANNNDNQTPDITVSLGSGTNGIRKNTIETVIPTPETYTGNNCGVISPGSRIPSSVIVDDTDDQNEMDDSDGSSSLSTSGSDLSASLSDESLEKFDEETDSMTDVSPLPSNCTSPLVKHVEHHFDVKQDVLQSVADINTSLPSCQKKEGVKFLDNVKTSSTHQADTVDVDTLLKAIKTLEVNQGASQSKSNSSTPFLTTNNKHRKNLTFANEDVRRIDQENQRLLKKIVLQQNRSKPHFTSVYSRPASSAVNRQKQQRQIELDNLALLKRLEAAKPSKDLSRLQLLTEYDHRSSTSSRASLRVTSRTSSQLSSCRSSARSCGRSSILNQNSNGKSVRTQPSTAAKVRKSPAGFNAQKM